MLGWVPRWHPLVWLGVIILVIAIVSDPTAMGHRAGDMIHEIQHWCGQLVVFAESI